MGRSNLETRTHIAIRHYLQVALPQNAAATIWHTANGENRSAVTGALLKRMGVRPGVGDLNFIHHGRLHELEVKTNSGRQTAEQKDRQRALIAAGARYAVVRSIDEVKEQLQEWAIPLRDVSA